jgi:hypothetical protein
MRTSQKLMLLGAASAALLLWWLSGREPTCYPITDRDPGVGL